MFSVEGINADTGVELLGCVSMFRDQTAPAGWSIRHCKGFPRNLYEK
jgi:hypothetical protein